MWRWGEYRLARNAGCSHAELVEITRLGVDLVEYRKALLAGVEHAQLVDAVTVHGSPVLGDRVRQGGV